MHKFSREGDLDPYSCESAEQATLVEMQVEFRSGAVPINNEPAVTVGQPDEAARNAVHDNDELEIIGTCQGSMSRGSVKLVHTVVSSFNKEKKDIVCSIDFGGMLSFPQLTKLNLKFSKWLLTRVDEETTSVVIDQNRIYKFRPTDVNNIFGVPAEGLDVRDNKLDRSDAAINKIRNRLGLNVKEARSLKAAQAILVKDYGGSMDQDQVDAFKTAFVLFIMGNFFAPSTKHNYCNIDYWPALVDPALIHTFNWGKYIIEELCDAAKKLKSDIRKNVSVSNISGCSLFLQVFYLNSVNLGALNIPEGTRPMIKCITMDRLRAMIAADTVHKAGTNLSLEFGASLPKQRELMIGLKRSAAEMESTIDIGVWNNAMHLRELLKLSNEGLTEVYHHIKRRKEFLMSTVTAVDNSFFMELSEIARRHGKNKEIAVTDNDAFSQICYDAGDTSSLLPASSSRLVNGPEVLCTTLNGSTLDEPATHMSFMELLSGSVNASDNVLPSGCVGCELSLFTSTDQPLCQKSGMDTIGAMQTENTLAAQTSEVIPCQEIMKAPRERVSDAPTTDELTSRFETPLISKHRMESLIAWEPSFDLITDYVESTTNQAYPVADTPSSIKGVRSNNGSTSKNVNSSSGKHSTDKRHGAGMDKYSPCSINKMLQESIVFEMDTRQEDDLNLNAKTLDFDISNSPFKKRRAKIFGTLTPVAKLVVDNKYPADVCEEFCTWAVSIRGPEVGKTIWIMHHIPSYLELKAQQVRLPFSGEDDFDHDLFSLVLRCFKQAEDAAPNQSLTGRKHYMETDVVARLMAGEAIQNYKSVRDQFIGEHIQYDLPNCKLIMLPAYTYYAWACYAIDLKEKRITVYDPSLPDEGDKAIEALHMNVCNRIKEAMAVCARHFFEDWQYEWDKLEVGIIRDGEKLSDRNRTGLHTLHFCKFFDGTGVRKDMTQADDEMSFASYLLYDLMNLKDNKARRPKKFVQVVDAE